LFAPSRVSLGRPTVIEAAMTFRPPPLLLSLFALLVLTGAAAAQTAAASSTFDISWSALDPSDDWTWKMLQSVFPVSGTPPTATGTAASVIGALLGQITGLVMAVAMSFLCYLTIINIHRVSESAQILTGAMSSLAAVRIGFAAIMMFPLASGFSVGQAGVMQVAGWGIGMARTLYQNAVKAIGPDAMVIADPIIPGTRTIVLGLMEDELCRSLINQATSATLIPAPTATVVNSGKGAVVTYAYSLAPGNGAGSAACGTVSVADSSLAAATLGGVTIDMANQQRSILESVTSSMRAQIDAIAQSYWQNKTESALSPLLSLYQSATQTYTQQLTSAAQTITAQLRSSLQAQDARDGNLGLSKNEVQLSTLGWTSAAAYYLGFARLNGLTLSLASGTPTVNMPSFEGLSPSLKADIAPLFTSSSSFLDKLKTYVATADGLTSPGGNADALTGQFTGTDGGGMMEKLFRALNFTPTLLQAFVDNLSPTAQNWADPFGGLIALGNQMILVAMTALGLAGIASTATGTAATTIFNALTMNWAGAVATLSLSALMQFFATPIFIGCMALLIPGLTIAFVLPMIPWVMWIASVAGYLILVCEAMVAVPLWMLAHLTFEGEGLHGRGLAGYELLFNILFRPVLMLVGLFLGYFIFTCISWLIRMSFGIAAGFVLGDGWIVTNWLGLFVLLSIFVLSHIVAAIASFRMISLIPHHLPRMIGFSSANRVDMDEFSQGAALIGGRKALTTIEAGVSPKRLVSEIGANERQGDQRLIGSNSGGRDGASSTRSGMDTTLQATTDMGGGSRKLEDE
jgi:conjugal transfer/type IV secretion protein DotA/TraY